MNGLGMGIAFAALFISMAMGDYGKQMIKVAELNNSCTKIEAPK